MRIYEIMGIYGNDRGTKTNVFVAEVGSGYWYVAEGSANVNFTYDTVEDGVWLERLKDIDMFSADEPVESVEQFEAELENRGV